MGYILTPSLDFKMQLSKQIPIRVESFSIQAFKEIIDSPHVVRIKFQKLGFIFNHLSVDFFGSNEIE